MNSAWIAGVGTGGQPFLAYVQDNSGQPHGKGRPRLTYDVFQLWVNGVSQTGGGTLDFGNITIRTR